MAQKFKHVEMIIDYIEVDGDFQYCDNRGLLIRCKDCRYFDLEKDKRKGYGSCRLHLMTMNIEFYCGDAEKKGVDEG